MLNEKHQKPHNIDDVCPITHILIDELDDPILVLETNYIYSKAALKKWVKAKIASGHTITDPTTMQILPAAHLTHHSLSTIASIRRSIANIPDVRPFLACVLIGFFIFCTNEMYRMIVEDLPKDERNTIGLQMGMFQIILMLFLIENQLREAGVYSLGDHIRQTIYNSKTDIEQTTTEWFEKNTIEYNPKKAVEEAYDMRL